MVQATASSLDFRTERRLTGAYVTVALVALFVGVVTGIFQALLPSLGKLQKILRLPELTAADQQEKLKQAMASRSQILVFLRFVC